MGSWRRVAVMAAGLVVLSACTTGEPPRATSATAPGTCPEPRTTERAPDSYLHRKNPLPATAENLDAGRRLYHVEARPVTCASCHGERGDGRGPVGLELVPPPRNFQCAPTMAEITDGQLYWVIQHGSGEYHLPAEQGAQQIARPGRRTRFTAMQAHRDRLSETETWQLVMYLRTLAGP
jgi:mono/diheme cytochrome c family protein